MDLKALQTIALDVAAARCLESVLAGIVDGLAREPHVALARIWLTRPGDICETCPSRGERPGCVDCLHLVASSGGSSSDPEQAWKGLEGRYRRFPLNVRNVGRVGGTGEALHLCFDAEAADWAVEPDGFAREKIETFAGQPLVFRGDVVGVLGVFCRSCLDEESFGWLRTFADQAAARTEALGDGYAAAPTNFRFMANEVLTTKEAVRAMGAE